MKEENICRNLKKQNTKNITFQNEHLFKNNASDQ